MPKMRPTATEMAPVTTRARRIDARRCQPWDFRGRQRNQHAKTGKGHAHAERGRHDGQQQFSATNCRDELPRAGTKGRSKRHFAPAPGSAGEEEVRPR